MAKILIDGVEHEVDEQKNLLATALSLGYNLPYFCWHPCLDSVGACRQCAVKQFRNEEDESGAIVMACMTAAADGSRISINDTEASEFRASVIEWLMINHPHDCPVCEEGGECHLQDMTLMAGHTRRRYRGRKRTHRNQNLGPFINHEMNRCIACYRCTRYYRDYAGGDDLNVFGAHDHVYFGRHSDGALESEFSGNLVEVCPTGVFTDKTLGAHYTRKWDMEHSPGICGHCALGCNTSPGARAGTLKRIQNRYHGQINGYFLCDRGRFGAGFVNRHDRPRTPLLRQGGRLEAVALDHAMEHLQTLLTQARGVVGIGSPRASLEGNHALRRLVGAAQFSNGMTARDQQLAGKALSILRAVPEQVASLRESESCDAVLVLGEDISNTAPRLALSLRQAVRGKAFALARANKIPLWHDRAVRDIAQQARCPLFSVSLAATRIDDIAAGSWQALPDDIARLGAAVAARVAGNKSGEPVDAVAAERVNLIAEALLAADKPLIVAGCSLGEPRLLQAAADICNALGGRARILLVPPEANTLGAALLGGLSVEQAVAQLTSGEADTLVVLENDLYRRLPKAQADGALDAARQVIVIDHSMQATFAKADVILPAGSFAEADGTLVNNEARAQRFFQVYPAEDAIAEGWRWCRDLIGLARPDDSSNGWHNLDAVIDDLIATQPELAAVRRAAPSAGFRQAGMRVPRLPHRYSGRTALHAHESVHERRPTPDPDTALAFSMEGWPGQRPAALLSYAWAPGWDSNQQAITRFQDEVGGALKGGDPGASLLADLPERDDHDDNQTEQPGTGDDWLAVPLYEVFGSEPMSALAPAIAERSPAPYFALHPESAGELAVAAGNDLTLEFDGETCTATVRLLDSLPRKAVGVPVGLAGLQGLQLPQRLRP